ncbi:hypothetical protein [Bradyrhizobium genosp. P]|uniref:hypothetical protein n=1 Tax=Bradyrhizobium genosp. P TaxID=83641 RepID=UPI003CFAA6CA
MRLSQKSGAAGWQGDNRIGRCRGGDPDGEEYLTGALLGAEGNKRYHALNVEKKASLHLEIETAARMFRLRRIPMKMKLAFYALLLSTLFASVAMAKPI